MGCPPSWWMPTSKLVLVRSDGFSKTRATERPARLVLWSPLGSAFWACALSSSVLARNFPGYGPYIAAKAGVEGLIRVFANELRGRQITANAVAPGPVATELFFKGKTPEQIAQLAAMNPLERLGEPEDIANLVVFLSSNQASAITGQTIGVDGGAARGVYY